MDDKIIITRKYQIIPIMSEMKQWYERVIDFTKNDLEEKIKYTKKRIKTEKDKEEKETLIIRLQNYEDIYGTIGTDDFQFTQSIINNYTYNLVRTMMEEEARKKNYILSWIYSTMIGSGVQHMNDLNEQKKFVDDTINYAYRVKGSKKGSLFDDSEISDTLGRYGFSFSKQLKSKIKDCIEDGLLDGKISLPNYKVDSPFSVEKGFMGFTHNYSSFEELCEHIDDGDLKLYFNYGSKGHPSIAKFKINLGHKKNREELKATLLKVYSGEYEYCGSSIQISKNKIILNLSMKIPVKSVALDENTVVGVDLGIAVPAMCALNNNMYIREAIGNKDDFLRIRTKIQKQIERLQKALKSTSGGHGRKKKLKALNRMKNAEANFVETYCHYVSKHVVDFALKHNAKYINIENLTGYNTSKFILRNWSYFKLQDYITYKANKYGIEVRKINPAYTSQVCSVCGHWERGQRKSQSVFKCANTDCVSHDKYKKIGFNADFNAARNIAMSTLWMEKGKTTEESKAKARKYYGIPDEVKEMYCDTDKKENNKVA